MNRIKKITQKEGAIYHEEMYDLRQKAKTAKCNLAGKSAFLVKRNPLTVIYLSDDLSQSEKEKRISRAKDHIDKPKFYNTTYNFE